MALQKPYDVIVVGAGLSGLRAAVTVQQAGLSCLILEANDRIGGKVLSLPVAPDGKATVDLGPAWINDTSQSHMFALGKKYSAEFEQQIEDGDEIFESEAGQIIRRPRGTFSGTPEEQQRTVELITTIDVTGQQIKSESFVGPMSQALNKLTFKKWVEQQTNNLTSAISLMNFMTRVLVGAEADEISALYMLKYIEAGGGFESISGVGKGTGQFLRMRQGSLSAQHHAHTRPRQKASNKTQGSIVFVNGLANELDGDSILTSCPVTSITQHDDYCTITTKSVTSTTISRTFKCRRAIISIPTPLYKHITFTPALPRSKTTLITTTRLGYYTKLIASYAEPWWRPHPLPPSSSLSSPTLSGEAQSFTSDGPITLVFDTSVPSQNQHSLSLFLVSHPGRKWSTTLQSDEERTRSALEHLSRLFAPFVVDHEIPHPTHTVFHDWSKQEWIEGAPSSLFSPGSMLPDTPAEEEGRGEMRDPAEVLREPVRHLHFVGTEMSSVWEGYMEGAVREGERGGREVVELLAPKKGWCVVA